MTLNFQQKTINVLEKIERELSMLVEVMKLDFTGHEQRVIVTSPSIAISG